MFQLISGIWLIICDISPSGITTIGFCSAALCGVVHGGVWCVWRERREGSLAESGAGNMEGVE